MFAWSVSSGPDSVYTRREIAKERESGCAGSCPARVRGAGERDAAQQGLYYSILIGFSKIKKTGGGREEMCATSHCARGGGAPYRGRTRASMSRTALSMPTKSARAITA